MARNIHSIETVVADFEHPLKKHARRASGDLQMKAQLAEWRAAQEIMKAQATRAASNAILKMTDEDLRRIEDTISNVMRSLADH